MATNAKPGRPAFKPTAVQRRQVRNAAAVGMSHEEIAVALEIHRHTLDKYFATELSSGALHRRMEIIDAMVKTALKGNVSAQKALLAMAPTLGAPPVEPAKPLGKKEQADVDAKGAQKGTDWDSLIGVGANVSPIRRAS